jgi:hypothetical protein
MKTINHDRLNAFANSGRNNLTASPESSAFSDFGFRRFSAECSQKLAALKDRLAADLANQFGTLNVRLVRQVVSEADSLAATTPFPSLFLPVLAEEKVRAASQWAARQQSIHEQTLTLAA